MTQGFGLDDLLALGEKVKDWKEQSRVEISVSYRKDDFKEKTEKTHRNSYYGNVPDTGRPPVTIRVTQRTGEYFDSNSHFTEDEWYEIDLVAGFETISGAKLCFGEDSDFTPQDRAERERLKNLFEKAQEDYHSRFETYISLNEQEKAEKDKQRVAKKARKILGDEK